MLAPAALLASVLGAFLVFWLELVAARQVAPALGGSPAVWNTSLFFFQAMLLAGYALVHVGDPARRRWRFVALYVFALAFPTVNLAGAVPGSSESAIALRLVALLAVQVGVPFLAVSMTAPLVQGWYARTGRDPYFLYAASNAGSLAAAVSIPLGLDRWVGLAWQAAAWRAGLFVLCGVMILAAWRLGPRDSKGATVVEPSSARDRLRWVLLAFVPCVLLHASTTAITTDVASLPLLWAATLAAYLASYAIAFSSLGPRLAQAAPVLAPVALLLCGLSLFNRPLPTSITLAAHLLGLFLLSTALHARLAAARPDPSKLTNFYLYVSVGGALGGLFSAVIAPVAYVQVAEYPLALLLAAAIVSAGESAAVRRVRWLVLGLLAGMLVVGWRSEDLVRQSPGIALGLVLCGLASFAFEWRRSTLASVALLSVATTQFALRPQGATVHAFRGAFGVHRVIEEPKLSLVSHLHGTTLHGRQSTDPARAGEPLTYFTREGPVGDLFAAREGPRDVLVIGLGIGTLAAHARAGDQWSFVEIDPEVVRIARNSQWFTYLERAAVTPAIRIDDGRVALALEERRFDVIVMDAFASDSVPVHLLTVEAMRLASSRLKPGGWLAYNVTNRTLDVPGVVAAAARTLGWRARLRIDGNVSDAEKDRGRAPSSWIVVAREEADLGSLATHPSWVPPSPLADAWTDDHADLLSAWKPRRD